MGTGESHAPTTPGAGRVGRLTVFRLLFKFYIRFTKREDPSTQYIIQLMWENPSKHYCPWSLFMLQKVFEIATCGKALSILVILQTSPPHTSWLINMNLGKN